MPVQVLVRIGGHKAKNTSEEHLLSFYNTWEEVKDRKFDGFIITGAPVETIAYEDVTYWDEMQQIFNWTETNVHSTLNVCWGNFHGRHIIIVHGSYERPISPRVTYTSSWVLLQGDMVEHCAGRYVCG